jgi:hypothetical protein
MKKLILIVALMMVSFNIHSELLLEKTNRDWISSVVIDENETRFRGFTSFIENGDVVVLVMDRISNDCNFQYMGINVVQESSAKSSFTSETLFGQLRIDKNPSHDVTYTATFVEGSKTAFLNIVAFNRETELVKELEKGNFARFKLKTDKAEFFLRFSLNGYKESKSRTFDLCTKYNQNSDNSYFNDETPKSISKNKKRANDDASYF